MRIADTKQPFPSHNTRALASDRSNQVHWSSLMYVLRYSS